MYTLPIATKNLLLLPDCNRAVFLKVWIVGNRIEPTVGHSLVAAAQYVLQQQRNTLASLCPCVPVIMIQEAIGLYSI